jgi:hypothetical protein
MSNSTGDEGLIEVLLERLEKQRLPRLLAIKEKVDANNPLDDLDLEFLETSMADARKAIPLIDRHPKYQALAAQVMELYKDISDKALEIEKGK